MVQKPHFNPIVKACLTCMNQRKQMNKTEIVLVKIIKTHGDAGVFIRPLLETGAPARLDFAVWLA